jgi:putative transposase
MSSHVHLIIGRNNMNVNLANIMRDFKRHTSKKIHELLLDQNQVLESRKKWMLWMMQLSGKRNGNNNTFQFWQQDNHPIEIYTSHVFHQKLNYIHDNPVTSGFVSLPEDWLYSSARNYANMYSVLEIEYLS